MPRWGVGARIGGVSFHHDAAEGYSGMENGGKGGLTESEDTSNAETEMGEGGEQLLSFLERTAKTMEDARDGVTKRTKGFHQFGMGGTAVDHEGKLETISPLCLMAESENLFVTAGTVPIKINTHFAHGHERMVSRVEHLLHAFEQRPRVSGKFRGMETHHGMTEVRILLTEAEHRIDGSLIDVGQKESLGSSFNGTSHDGITVGFKFSRVDMGMGVDIGHTLYIYR